MPLSSVEMFFSVCLLMKFLFGAVRLFLFFFFFFLLLFPFVGLRSCFAVVVVCIWPFCLCLVDTSI